MGADGIRSLFPTTVSRKELRDVELPGREAVLPEVCAQHRVSRTRGGACGRQSGPRRGLLSAERGTTAASAADAGIPRTSPTP